MITFGANLINKTNIQKYNVNKGYSEYSAYMIKLDPESQSDRFALSEINKSWKNSTTFADCIDNAFKLKHIGSFEYKNTEFFALTKQSSDFKNLNPNDILGLAMVDKNKSNVNLRYLQCDPNNNYSAEKRNFKYLGSVIISSLKKMFPDKTIFTNATVEAIPFYEKQGFKKEIFGMILKH